MYIPITDIFRYRPIIGFAGMEIGKKPMADMKIGFLGDYWYLQKWKFVLL